MQVKRPAGRTSTHQPARGFVQEAKPSRPSKIEVEKIAPAKAKPEPEEREPRLRPVSRAREIPRTRPGHVAREAKREPVPLSPTVSAISEDDSMKAAALEQSKGSEKPVEAKVVTPAEPPPAPAAKEQVNKKRIEAIPLIGELPYDIKEKLGKLQINVHSYSEDPAERLVFINMHRYKVGDKIGEGGPLLKEIIPNGVIIDYGEGEARLQVR